MGESSQASEEQENVAEANPLFNSPKPSYVMQTFETKNGLRKRDGMARAMCS